jgi:hypothetical protein
MKTRATMIAAAVLALAGCRAAQPTNNQAEPQDNAATNAVETDAAVAERLVRQRLGPAGTEARIVEARAGTREGVSVVCGALETGGRRQRYIVVDGEDVFVESEMRAGEMDRSVAEFCGDGERG